MNRILQNELGARSLTGSGAATAQRKLPDVTFAHMLAEECSLEMTETGQLIGTASEGHSLLARIPALPRVNPNIAAGNFRDLPSKALDSESTQSKGVSQDSSNITLSTAQAVLHSRTFSDHETLTDFEEKSSEFGRQLDPKKVEANTRRVQMDEDDFCRFEDNHCLAAPAYFQLEAQAVDRQDVAQLGRDGTETETQRDCLPLEAATQGYINSNKFPEHEITSTMESSTGETSRAALDIPASFLDQVQRSGGSSTNLQIAENATHRQFTETELPARPDFRHQGDIRPNVKDGREFSVDGAETYSVPVPNPVTELNARQLALSSAAYLSPTNDLGPPSIKDLASPGQRLLAVTPAAASEQSPIAHRIPTSPAISDVELIAADIVSPRRKSAVETNKWTNSSTALAMDQTGSAAAIPTAAPLLSPASLVVEAVESFRLTKIHKVERSNLVEDANISWQRNLHVVKVRLQPEKLGEVELHIRMTENTMSLNAKVESSEAAQILAGDMRMIAERLTANGLRVEHFTIQARGDEVTTPANNQFSSESGYKPSGRERQDFNLRREDARVQIETEGVQEKLYEGGRRSNNYYI